MNKDYSYFIDFDGVILDTQRAYDKAIIDNKLKEYCDVYNYIDFNDLINIKNQINNSIGILKEVYNKLDIKIITKVNNELEIEVKKEFLKKHDINIEVIGVPFYNNKTDYVDVNDKCVLVDDDEYNIYDWKSHGGIAYHFGKDINSLDFLKDIC